MKEYPKIQTVFKRDLTAKRHPIIQGAFTTPEFEFLKDCEWVFTEKVDGTNVRIEWNDHGRFIRGRTAGSNLPTALFDVLEELFPKVGDTRFETWYKPNANEPMDVCFAGEGYGQGTQKRGWRYNTAAVSFVLFDVRIGPYWLERKAVESIADHFGLEIVPVIGKGSLDNMVKMVKQGVKSQWGDFEAEGIVARPAVEMVTRLGNRIITKVKYVDFERRTNNGAYEKSWAANS